MIPLLLKKASLGCKDSRNTIICKFLHVTKKVARRYSGLGIEMQDLEQEGIIGLYQAIEAFDAAEDCSFETYATRRVFTVIDEYVLLNKDIYSIPLYKLKKLRAAKNRLDSGSDERHHDKGINIDDFDIKAISTELTEVAASPQENFSTLSNNEQSDILLPNIINKISEHEGGKFLIANTLFGESISNIAKNYSVKPYLVNKLIQDCINDYPTC